MEFAGIFGLMKNTRFAAAITETGGRNLAPGVAVDAAFVDVKFTFNILRKPLIDLSHRFAPLLIRFRSPREVSS